MTTATRVSQPDLERIVGQITADAEEEVERGRRRRGGGRPMVHSQVRRVREEDLRIGDDAGEGLRAVRAAVAELGSRVGGVILCSRPWALPGSPLGNNKAAAVRVT